VNIRINNYASDHPDKVVVIDSSNKDVFEVNEHCADGSIFDWKISRSDLQSAPQLKWPEPIPLVTVPAGEGAQGGHWWMSNDVYRKFSTL